MKHPHFRILVGFSIDEAGIRYLSNTMELGFKSDKLWPFGDLTALERFFIIKLFIQQTLLLVLQKNLKEELT